MNQFRKTIQLLMSTLIILSFNFTFAENESNLLEKYISEFKILAPEDKKHLCQKIMWSGLSDPSLFDLIEQDLLRRSKSQRDKGEVDNVAWLLKALGSSGQTKYITTLQNLTTHNNSKIVKYAKEGLNLIQQYAKWNPIISNSSNFHPEKSEVINHYANMIRSDILELNVLAGKRIFAEKIRDNYLYKILSEKILSGHKLVPSKDKMKIAAYAWMMRASALTNIATVAEVKATGTNKKLKSYAKKYISENN